MHAKYIYIRKYKDIMGLHNQKNCMKITKIAFFR